MVEALTTQEAVAVEEFLAEVRCREQSQNATLVSQITAVKFLMARKFDVSRAIDLFQAYKNTRIKEGIYNINPNEEPLRTELLSGKFTVLPGRDSKGAALALFIARLHRPDLTTHKAVLQAIIYQLDKAIENIQTQRDGLIFIYDMTNSTYSNFDYDLCVKILKLLKGAFPARLKCVFIVSSPLWFRAPFAVLRLFVREKLRERVCTVKAQELASHIPISSLPEHLGGSSQYNHIAWIQSCINSSLNNPTNSPYATPDCLGGLLGSCSPLPNQTANAIPHSGNSTTLLRDELNCNCPLLDDGNANLQNLRHAHWNGSALPGSGLVTHPNVNILNGHSCGRHPPPQSDTPPDTPLHQKHATETGATKGGVLAEDLGQDGNGAEDSHRECDNFEEEAETGDGVPPLPQKSARPTPLSRSPEDGIWLPGMTGEGLVMSIHIAEPGGMTMQELVQHVKSKKKKGIYQEYEEIRREPPAGTFNYSKKPANQIKNRYSDVLCLDESRVRLFPVNDEDDETSDYINASFMDGYKMTKAYIATQGPLPKTFADFWRMVWEQMVLIIVMTTRVMERGRVKCGQYWPLEVSRTEEYGYFLVRNVHTETFQDFKITHLELYNSQTGECREVSHYLYVSWPDFGVPKSASAMLDFRARVKQRQELALQTLYPHWTGPPGGPPIVVHCSAGIGRTGTFCTLDICLSRLEDIGTVNVKRTVQRMRMQRAFSIQTWDQYYFCYKAVIEHAQQTGRLLPIDWSDTEPETDSE
ncbi:tyrosine-protein phosphatase non-receptor type 9 isoform X1 [Electrophorus electricus]|uniref:tyrosine-protein phosphatase non-receptor type 9 isoform X1 n=2 Tax=Electrophorus electricus TaxID=8005 RepID=UPI0015CFE041|nr:tyrosine-protein phosphatase non-receptor type 9 isoform X1 [Electrophorus electricus]